MSVGIASGGGTDEYHQSSSQQKKNALTIDLETIRLHASSVYARLQSRVSIDTLRPLPMFLGINSGAGGGFSLSQAFSPPVRKLDKTTLEKVRSRVNLNFAFFLTNYVLVATMVAIVVALMHVGMLFFIAIVYGLWAFHSFLIRHELELFGLKVHNILSIQQRFYLLFVITAIVVICKCLKPTLIFLAISAVLILSHAFLRDPKHIDASSDLLGSKYDGTNDSDDDEEAAGGSNSSGSDREVVLVERPTRGH